MTLSRALTRGAVCVLLAGTAACGASSVAPKIELRNAVGAIADAGSGSITVSLPSSRDDVRAFLTATGQEGSPSDDTALGHLLDMELALAHDRGEDSESTADDASLVQVRIDGEEHGEMRAVDEVIYLRVDLPALSERIPEMAGGVDALRAELDATDLGAIEPVAEAALDGEWLSVDMGEGSWLAEQQQGMQDRSMQLPDDFGDRLLDLAGQAMSSSVSVRRDGEDETGDRLVATANTRELYTNIAAELPNLLGELATGAEEALPPASDVPSRDVSVTFWVEDGELRRLELDLAQFLEEPAGHFVIRADIGEAPSIEAPDDAVAVDMEQLVEQSGALPEQLLGGFLGAGGGVDIEAAATAVGQEFQAYASFIGAAPSVEHLPVIAESFAGMDPPVELLAVGDRVQVTYGGEDACLTLGPDPVTEGTVTPGPC